MSKNPLRRLTDELVLASMRPPIAPQLMLYRPGQHEIDLEGKRILLTGASSGIGEAAAIKFARRGATVMVVARRKDLLDDVANRILADGGDAIAIDCDLSDLDAVDALAAGSRRRSAASTSSSTTPAGRSAARWPSRWSGGTTSSGR